MREDFLKELLLLLRTIDGREQSASRGLCVCVHEKKGDTLTFRVESFEMPYCG